MNYEFLKYPRKDLEDSILNSMARVMSSDKYEAFRKALTGASDSEFYTFLIKTAQMNADTDFDKMTFKDLLNLSQKTYAAMGTNPKNSALNTTKPHFLTAEDLADIQNRIAGSHPNDVIHLTHEEDDEIMGLWQHGRDNSHGISVPSDIFFADTVPLKDCKIVVDERGLPDGQLCEYRVVIFDYRDEMEQADFNTPIPIGTLLVPYRTGQIVIPFCAVRGVDSLLSGSIGFIGFPRGSEERSQKYYSQQEILNMTSSLLSTWYGIQIALLHPQVRKVFRTPHISTAEKKTSPNRPQKRKVRYVKTYVLNKDELVNAIYGEQHTVNRRALVWYVIGHWRTYTSGKKVFIQPYWKGALRDIKQNAEERERIIYTGGTENA